MKIYHGSVFELLGTVPAQMALIQARFCESAPGLARF